MRKRQLAAILLAAAMMMVQMPMTAMAEVTINGVVQTESEVTINGDLHIDGAPGEVAITADAAGDRVTVNGDVVSENARAITAENGASVSADSVTANGGDVALWAEGNNTSVTIAGNVAQTSSGGGFAIYAVDGAAVSAGNASGKVGGVIATGKGATVTLTGIATGNGMGGAEATDGADVRVGSAVDLSNVGAIAADGGTLTVAQSVSGGSFGIEVYGDGAKVTVKENASGGQASVCVLDAWSGSKGGTTEVKDASVVVLGNADGSIRIETNSDRLASEGSAEALAKDLGTIIVGSVTPTEGQNLVTVADDWDSKTGALTEENKAEIAKAVAENTVYYIVNTEKTKHGTITVTKASNVIEVKDADGNTQKDKNGNTLYAANRTDTVTVKIEAASGYEVTGADGGKATLTKNEDGSYTLNVPEGGGIDISAVISAIYRESSDDGNGNSSTSVNVTYADGAQKTFTVNGWQQNGSSWSFVNNSGILLKNCWAKLTWKGAEDWYSFDENGVMRTGWYEENGKRYYLNSVSDGYKGKMVTGDQVIDGKNCHFAGTGEQES